MSTDATTAPLRLGAYELRSRVGEGGMGVVYRSAGPDGREVAVKVLRAHVAGDAEGRDRFAREVRAMRRVRGPHVAEVVDADVTAATPYIVTRYVDGPALQDVVADAGPLTDEALVRLGRGLADALRAVHGGGVVHRDLKPGNVLLRHGEPVVIDFGIARLADETRLTSTGLVVGTPGYLAPEVIEGSPATTASDVYSWGATLAYAATGRPPFGRGPLEAVMYRVMQGRPDLDGAPAWLVPVLRTAMHREQAGRPRPGDLAGLLERAAARRHEPGERRHIATGVAAVTVPAELPGTRPEPAPDRTPAAAPSPAEARPAAPPRPHPILTLLLLAVAATAGALAPVVALLALVVACVLARAVDRQGRFLGLRRDRRGRTVTYGFAAAAALPWHAVRSVLFTLLTLPIAAAAAGALLVLGALVAPSGVPMTDPHLLGGLGLALTSIVAWWGVEGEGLRLGTRRVLGLVSRPRPLTFLVGLALLVVACLLAYQALHGPVHLAPLPDLPPRSLLAGVLHWLRDLDWLRVLPTLPLP